MKEEQKSDVVEGEVIVDESPGGEPGGTRTLRVYDKARGDFELEIPSECSITFGYFNPASAGAATRNDWRGNGADTMRTTCLRIYAGATSKTPQLGAFLGVDGFRDKTLQITRLRQRVVIESNFEDDGKGNEKFNRDVQRQLERAAEDDEAPF